MSARSQAQAGPQPDEPHFDRCLTLLVEGVALNVPEIDAAVYKSFREAISTMARSLPDRLPESDALPIIKAILREFEVYRKGVDEALRERQSAWRDLAGTLTRELMGSLGVDPGAAPVAPLVERAGALTTGQQIQEFGALLNGFLNPNGNGGGIEHGAPFKRADRSTTNDNAAGLRGGGAAQEYLKRMLDRGAEGFVVLFRLSCLDVIGERFGLEALHDSLMAVAAFLTQSLRGDDAVFHWSDSSLLAILETPATEQILIPAMQRIVNSNRDITIRIGERNVMLRIPFSFELTPFAQFRSSEDLVKMVRMPKMRP
jgi:GGDEF domain-containing protein